MGWMSGIFAMGDEERRLTELEKTLGSARLKGEKKCLMCGFCCHKRTCIPTPDELEIIAKFLKMDIKDCINKYYAIDQQGPGDYYLKPVGENIKDLAGKFIPSERTFNEGQCIFLGKGNKCQIHEVKPKAAKNFCCWKPADETNDSTKDWKDDQLKKRFGIDGRQKESETERDEDYDME